MMWTFISTFQFNKLCLQWNDLVKVWIWEINAFCSLPAKSKLLVVIASFKHPCGIVLARNVDAISTSPMSELCELRRLRALEDSRLSPAKPRQASTATEAALVRWHTVARRGACKHTHGEEKHGRKGKRKRWLRKPCMARLKGVFFRFLKRVWRPTNGPTVGPSFCPSVRRQKFSAAWLSWAHWSTRALFLKLERVDCNEMIWVVSETINVFYCDDVCTY